MPPFDGLAAGNKSAFHTHDNRHESEARTARRYYISARIALARQSADGVRKIPKIFESLLLHQSHQFLIRNERKVRRFIDSRINLIRNARKIAVGIRADAARKKQIIPRQIAQTGIRRNRISRRIRLVNRQVDIVIADQNHAILQNIRFNVEIQNHRKFRLYRHIRIPRIRQNDFPVFRQTHNRQSDLRYTKRDLDTRKTFARRAPQHITDAQRIIFAFGKTRCRCQAHYFIIIQKLET